jgi:hypothetical protein
MSDTNLLDEYLNVSEIARGIRKNPRTVIRFMDRPENPLPYIKLGETRLSKQ